MACLLCLVIFDYEFVAWTFCGRPEDLYWECFFQRGFTLAPNSSQRHHWSENISDPTEGLGIERIPGCGFSKDWEKPASGLRVPVACCRHTGSQDRQLCLPPAHRLAPHRHMCAGCSLDTSVVPRDISLSFIIWNNCHSKKSPLLPFSHFPWY